MVTVTIGAVSATDGGRIIVANTGDPDRPRHRDRDRDRTQPRHPNRTVGRRKVSHGPNHQRPGLPLYP